MWAKAFGAKKVYISEPDEAFKIIGDRKEFYNKITVVM